jgi:transketolase
MDAEAIATRRVDRNHFILSKGHAAPALYAAFAAIGLIRPEELLTLRVLGSRLQGHPDRSVFPEVEMSTGSLGQGLSAGLGLAWQMTRQRATGQIYVVVGDGELDEGQVWEAIGYAGAHRTGNLTVMVDANGVQNDGFVKDVLDLRPYPPKLEAFGWKVLEIDGHDHHAITGALDEADRTFDQAVAIVAHTVKGHGVSFMEHNPSWHSHGISDEQLATALAEVMA